MAKSCSQCGEAFECGVNDGACWCFEIPKVYEPAPGVDCFCPNCLRNAADDKKQQKELELVAGRDYYMEGQALVFTAQYHLRRGYCCESGCRHCPYT